MDYKILFDKITEYKTILIHGHTNPDGDCLGSQFGLKHIILENFKNKNVFVVGESSTFVSFLGNVDTVEDSLYKEALCICVDTGTVKQISDQRFFTGAETIKVDHHLPIDSYAKYNLVNELLPACTLVITNFAVSLNLKINKDAARALYTGLVTDTGRFIHGITPETFTLASTLISAGADAKELHELTTVENPNLLKYKGFILNNFIISENGVAYAFITEETRDKYDVTYEEACNQVGLLSTMKGVPVWCLFLHKDDIIRCRIRSKGPRIDEIANKYNGGGHKFASGIVADSIDTVNKIINDLDLAVKKFKEV